jgi:L-galactose dehydrogenase/L-glyceraldehyde 3-phosphate reductase
MEQRPLGRTGLHVSTLGFGAGAVGGLMIHGTPTEQQRVVGRAIELGVNYFDTAASYGDGVSEQSLGRALAALGAREHVLVGTKFRLERDDLDDIGGAVRRSLDASLARLRVERVDLLQLHNALEPADVSVAQLLEQVVPALEALRSEGKTRFFGITASGETQALQQVLEAEVLHTTQVFFNLLNPTAAYELPASFPAHDFDALIDLAAAHATGVIVIRALAAGVLSGDATRHPYALSTVAPLYSGPDRETDVARARELEAVLVGEGQVETLLEAALRFPLASEGVSTVLVGISSLEQLEQAAACIAKGPLANSAIERLSALWQRL